MTLFPPLQRMKGFKEERGGDSTQVRSGLSRLWPSDWETGRRRFPVSTLISQPTLTHSVWMIHADNGRVSESPATLTEECCHDSRSPSFLALIPVAEVA